MQRNSEQENGKKTMEMVQVAKLIDLPEIAAQQGWKTWEATISDLSVRCVLYDTFTRIRYYAVRGANKKGPGTIVYDSRPDMVSLCEMVVKEYGRQDAVDSSQWAVKQSPLFLH